MTAVATQEIPLVDLRAQYATIRDEVRKAIDEVLDSMQLTIGPNVRAFDNEFASYIGTKHSIGVGSGTDALQLAIRACGVSGGDEVITVSHTFFATVEAILDRKSTRLNSSHRCISYAVFCLKKKIYITF